MFITKARHEREIADLELEIAKLKGAREMDALTIAQHDERFKKAVKDLEMASGNAMLAEQEIAALRPDALAMRRKRQMDRDRRKGRG